MWLNNRVIAEERLVLIRFNEIKHFLMDQIGRISSRLHTKIIPKNLKLIIIPEEIRIVMVCDTLTIIAIKAIKAHVKRFTWSLWCTQAPLAKYTTGVSRTL